VQEEESILKSLKKKGSIPKIFLKNTTGKGSIFQNFADKNTCIVGLKDDKMRFLMNQVPKPKDIDFHLYASILNLSDEINCFSYLGMVDPCNVRRTRKTAVQTWENTYFDDQTNFVAKSYKVHAKRYGMHRENEDCQCIYAETRLGIHRHKEEEEKEDVFITKAPVLNRLKRKLYRKPATYHDVICVFAPTKAFLRSMIKGIALFEAGQENEMLR